jgi:putative transposase
VFVPGNTYFVSSNTLQFRRFLQSERSAALFIEVLYHYRTLQKYALHEFVVMPNHFHLILTPATDTTLERTIQLIKGGFSFQSKERFGRSGPMWLRSFHDRRIRDAAEYVRCRDYLHRNPVEARLCERVGDWHCGSAAGRFPLDEIPQRLKPFAQGSDSHG